MAKTPPMTDERLEELRFYQPFLKAEDTRELFAEIDRCRAALRNLNGIAPHPGTPAEAP